MNQKLFINIVLVIAIVVLVSIGGYFVFVKKSEPVTNQPTTQAHTSYKKVFSKSFDYGTDEQQFGIIRVAGGSGPSSFSTDNRNYLYIADSQNNRLKIFNSDGKQLSLINTPSFSDIVVDDNGNIYGYTSGSGYPGEHLYKYNNSGSLLGKIENHTAFSEIFSSKNPYGNLYIVGNKLYISDAQQNSYSISSTEGSLKSENTTKVDGIYGLSGKRYKTNYASGGTVYIINKVGVTEKTIATKIDGLATIIFLGEDRDGNFYIQTEISDKVGVKLQVRKYNSSAELLTILDIPNNDYSVPTAKLLHVDQTGDIWRVAPGKNKLFVNRWSTVY